jgi:hypothetical protein
MVERGWARTRSDPTDGRRTLVFVGEDVRGRAERYKGVSEARTLDRLLAGLPPRRRQAILGALEYLLEVLRQQPAEEYPGTRGALHRGLASGPEPSPPLAPSSARSRSRR